MDCVKPHAKKEVRIKKGKILGKNPLTGKQIGLGMDDANGICVALQLLKEFPNLKVCFTTEEEVGFLGAQAACDNLDFFCDVSYFIQADRHGKSDLITYTNGIYATSEMWLEHATPVMARYGYTEEWGIGTDIGILAETLQLSAVNVSCGYYREHTDYSKRNVAKILGVSRNTVKKYWEGQTVPWERKPGSGRKNDIITDEVRTFIIRCLESDKNAPRKQRHTAHKIYERLIAECGFEGCEASVRRTVAELRCNIHDIFVPLSYEPAEAVQIDWGEATVILEGCKQKIQIWCMRECYSGDIFVTAFYRQNEESFLEGYI
jgi:predicted transcriptional regulator